MLDFEPLEFPDSPYDKFENCPACGIWGLNTVKIPKKKLQLVLVLVSKVVKQLLMFLKSSCSFFRIHLFIGKYHLMNCKDQQGNFPFLHH